MPLYRHKVILVCFVVKQRADVVKHWQSNEGNSLLVCIIGLMQYAKYTPSDYWKTLETMMTPSIKLLVEGQQKTIEELNAIIS